MTLPDCMMPDGADPCRGYHELRAEADGWSGEARRRATLLFEKDAEIKRLRTALQIFADDENWRFGRRLDPNGSRFDGTEIARAAMKPKP